MNWFLPARKSVPAFILAAGLGVIVMGCTTGAAPNASPGAADSSTFTELANKQLGGLAGVEDIGVFQSPRDLKVDPEGLDGLDASIWNVEIAVTMAETATPEETLSASRAALALSEEWAVDEKWTARIIAGRETTRPEDDISPRRALSFEVFPSGDLQLTNLVEGALRISQMPGVNTVSTFRGRTLMTSLDATLLQLAYANVSSEALFAAGGDYGTTDGRVQLTVLPDQVSPAVVRAIIEQAANFPMADVALVAPLDGPSAPSLFINGVSAADAAAIFSALSNSTLAAELVPPFTIPIAIRSGAGDQSGFVGGVDPASR